MPRRAEAALLCAALVVLSFLSVGAASAAAADPSIGGEWVSDVGPQTAVLHAEVDPNGALTKYKLQIDESGAYEFFQEDCGVLHVPGYSYCQHEVPGERRAEPEEGTIPAGTDSVLVSADLYASGVELRPGVTYHYRVIAANGAQVVEGPDQTFTTPTQSNLPRVVGQSVSGVSPTDATLNATIDPNGSVTHYKLQIDTTGQFSFHQSDSCVLHPPGVACAWIPNPGETLPAGLVEPPESAIPGDGGTQTVSVDLAVIGAVLQPGMTYHYRAIAANGVAVVEGPSQTFTTPLSSAVGALPGDGQATGGATVDPFGAPMGPAPTANGGTSQATVATSRSSAAAAAARRKRQREIRRRLKAKHRHDRSAAARGQAKR